MHFPSDERQRNENRVLVKTVFPRMCCLYGNIKKENYIATFSIAGVAPCEQAYERSHSADNSPPLFGTSRVM